VSGAHESRDLSHLHDGVIREYQVVSMTGIPSTSGIYSSLDLGPDALKKAVIVQAARGGTIMGRTITVSKWFRSIPESKQ
jgi:hypothetical protein